MITIRMIRDTSSWGQACIFNLWYAKYPKNLYMYLLIFYYKDNKDILFNKDQFRVNLRISNIL